MALTGMESSNFHYECKCSNWKLIACHQWNHRCINYLTVGLWTAGGKEGADVAGWARPVFFALTKGVDFGSNVQIFRHHAAQ